jgi:hypothetical protein
VCFEVHLGIESNELLLQAFRLPTDEMILHEMGIHRFIVEEVLWHSPTSPITDVTLLMIVPAMNIELIVTVEPRPTERA